MKKLTDIIKKIFSPPPALAAVLAVLGFGSVAAVLFLDIKTPALRYGSYLASSYALAVVVFAAVGLIKKHPVSSKLRETNIGQKYFDDIHFRNRVSLYVGLIINLAYIVIKLISGIIYRSPWFISLAVYYVLLALMRLGLIRRADGRAGELKRYRFCGFTLLIMNQALAGIVIFMVHQNRHFTYPGYLIYAMAAYSFYAVINAAINISRSRRHNSPILSAAKAVNLVAALVSILSLTTAMLAQFGGEDDPKFTKFMTAAVGGAVCTIVIAMAMYMIYRANKGLRELKSKS